MTPTSTPAAPPTTVLIAPTDVVVDANIRSTVKTDKPFWASVKQDGVLVPLIVELRPDGTHHLIDGQRRILAAIDAGLTQIPATIISSSTSDSDHIVRQLVVNEHREQLTDADRVAAMQTLFDYGLTADQIARKTKTPRPRVDNALKIIASPTAANAIANTPAITLDQAAALADFEDSPEISEKLAAIAADSPSRFAHELSRARDDRAIAQARATAIADLEAAGVPLLLQRPDYDNKTILALRELSPTAAAAKAYTSIELENHTTCPGHAIYVHASIDWGADRAVTVTEHPYCTDWKANGHFKRGSTATGGAVDAAEKEARRQARENNKAWTSATPVRIAFLQTLLTTPEPPKGWDLFVAQYLARGTDSDYRIRSTVENLLQITNETGQGKWLDAHPNRAPQLLLAHALASIEGEYEYGKSGWKNSRTPDYLRVLSTWGYTLSDIEETTATSAKAKR
ncbi:ParB/RepB/Spo0J family partition protein [Microcella sp.]|uniref:ParB/RepB/Spo0J family partition protein n=1 Tax=Microcella sp. TaxID=1913979 RepID=UPI003919E62C